MLWTTYYDIGGRLKYGDVEGAWTVWNRMLDQHEEVRAFGGVGSEFYRAYYAVNPGKLQGGGPAGGLGLDEEFVENLLTPSAWVVQWLGVQSNQAGRLRIAPRKPAALEFMAASNITYRGNIINVRHEEGVIDLAGSTISAPGAGQLKLVFFGEFAGGDDGAARRLARAGRAGALRGPAHARHAALGGALRGQAPTTGWMLKAN